MPSLPFQQIRQIEQLLSQVDTKDLVLIFSQVQAERFLLVYNNDHAPPPLPEVANAKRLVRLHRTDYIHFDGPVVGFSALDLMLADLPTHGIRFYSIERILRRLGRQAECRQTAHQLARTMLTYVSLESVWFWHDYAKIIRLALPALLNGRSFTNLVAILPTSDEHDFLDKPDNLRLFYNDPTHKNNLDALRRQLDQQPEQWVIALEELTPIHTALSKRRRQPFFINLSSVLRQIGQHNELDETCRLLARVYWKMGQTSGSRQWLYAAQAMAIQSWLAKEDPTDLVALLPHRDFHHFLATGDGLRVYRAPELRETAVASPAGPRCSLGELLRGQVVLADYDGQSAAFPVLHRVLQTLSPQPMLDIGPLLWRSSQHTNLARTLWLLSRDLLRLPNPEWAAIQATPAAITDLAIRAAMLYSLSDPWEWRQGRYEQLLRQCYQHVDICLSNEEKKAANAADAAYFRARRNWYGCFANPDPIHNLSEMARAGKAFQERHQPARTHSRRVKEMAQLVQIGEDLTRLETGSATLDAENRQSPFAVSAFQQAVVNSQIAIPNPSPPFAQQLRLYQAAHEQWQAVQNAIGSERPSFETLDQLLDEYARQQRSAYAPAHELAVLHWAIQEDVDRINRFKQAIEIGPVINIRLRTPWITLGIRERLSLEIENLGGAAAYRFRLELNLERTFDLFTQPAVLFLDSFPPGKPHRLEWEIRARSAPMVLSFNYRFRDHQGEDHIAQETLTVSVTEPHGGRLKPKGNLYQAGPPVFGSGRFFGRRHELEQIITRLLGGITQPILLRGPRRMGKTSILRQLERMLQKPQEAQSSGLAVDQIVQLSAIYPVFHTLQAVDDPNNPTRFFQSIFEDICAALGTGCDLEQAAQQFALSPTRAFRQQTAKLLDAWPQVRVLIIIDEWDELYRPEYSKLARNLRSLMEAEERVNWLVSSTWTLSEESSKYGSPFYNQAFTIELREMDWDSAVQLVKEPSEKMGVTWHGEAVVQVLEQTGRRPYLMQLVCSKIVDNLRQRTTTVVDSGIVSIALNQIIQEARATAQYFGFLWGDVQPDSHAAVRWMGRLILWTLADRGMDTLTRSEIRLSIEDTCRRRGLPLPDGGFLDREFDDQITQLQWIFDALTSKEDRYGFSVPLARRWLRQSLSYQEDPVKQAHAGLMREWRQQEGA